LDDEQVCRCAAGLGNLYSGIPGSQVIDSSVIRLPQAVTHLRSYLYLLPTQTSFGSVFMCSVGLLYATVLGLRDT